ncbi:hypothetical protein [Yokenella regensburgei]|uniref:Uncharacterized protein n=1 Tax=Yokenella regensburgei TaxID=158877 RepID=A0AB38FVD0_9ENTR|nr:hypothetical protein [Yokenella regensburgei]KFD24802.1 hypothetical protein GYRE_00771 [Yokenella regensburgei ATCC 49455]SQA62981.1 Uncharacterised protein [Yokenella regensburgei]SQB02224.1 Uncharacterised protein [Yokenella regensburgei]SUQ07475.1 Uncharacterised protein [Yokenella regensburgei]
MSFSVPFLSLRGGLLFLTAALLSFSSPHTATSRGLTAAPVCSPAEARLRRDLLEAQRRFALLRAKNFRLRQQLLWTEMKRDAAKAQLWAVRDKSVTGDIDDLTRTDTMALTVREWQEYEPQDLRYELPLRPEIRHGEESR